MKENEITVDRQCGGTWLWSATDETFERTGICAKQSQVFGTKQDPETKPPPLFLSGDLDYSCGWPTGVMIYS